MKNLKICIALIFVLPLSLQLIAQERIIFGKVTAFRTIGLSNIEVISKKTKNTTLTDKNGMFTINCADDDQITFNSECFEHVKKKMKNEKDTISVNLYFVNTPKNQEIAVYNNYIDEKTLKNALLSMPNPTKDFSKYTDIYQLIKGECPNVQIKDNQILVPPLSSVYESKGALIVLDDSYVSDISYIIPSQVISIQLLKGSSASFYGLRGANGVVVIKTFGRK